MSRIYISSRWQRAAQWRALRDGPHRVPIVSTWIDDAVPGHPAVFTEHWQRNLRDIQFSRVLILYAEPQDLPLRGALVEVGAALAFGRPVFLVMPGIELHGPTMSPLGSWILHHNVTIVQGDIHDAILLASRL